MREKLAEVEKRYEELESLMLDSNITANRKEYARVSKERSDLEQIVADFREWKKVEADIEGNKALLEEDDEDIRELAKAELPGLRDRRTALEERLRLLLLPKDPNDEKNVILEI